jgi:hypothetical protein
VSAVYVPISTFTQRNSELNFQVLIFHRLWFLKLLLNEVFFSACRQCIVCLFQDAVALSSHCSCASLLSDLILPALQGNRLHISPCTVLCVGCSMCGDEAFVIAMVEWRCDGARGGTVG